MTKMFSLGYSTYATKMLDPFIALPMIKQIGYNSIEICLSDDWPTYPGRFSLEEQDRLKDLCQELEFSSPAFFAGISAIISLTTFGILGVETIPFNLFLSI